MNWPMFAIFAYLMLALEMGLSSLLRIGEVTPSFLLIFAVFLGLSAPVATVMWSFLVIGILVDLTHPLLLPDGMSDMVVIGPAALGYLFAGYAVLQIRGMLYRESTTTAAFMVAILGICMHLVAVAMLSLRGLPMFTAQPPAGWSAADELVRRFWELLYTAVLAVPLCFLLWRLERLFNFNTVKSHARRS